MGRATIDVAIDGRPVSELLADGPGDSHSQAESSAGAGEREARLLPFRLEQ
jgi:hypothetical protein